MERSEARNLYRSRTGYPVLQRANVLPLRPHERCVLYRRRSGKMQAEVAKEIGCCRYWLNKMERGLVPCDDLLWYWEQ